MSATTAVGFRFAQRWLYYRIIVDKDAAGSTTVSATLVALT